MPMFFPPDETFLPPDETLDYIEGKYGKRHSKSWLAKLRCIGGGPKFHKAGWSVLYTPPDVDEWYPRRLSPKVSSTSELSQIKREAQ
jgi:hypothetical protein